MEKDKTVSGVVDLIVDYFIQHPDAADTAVGVGYWLNAAGFRNVRMNDIQQGLDILVGKGLIERHLLPDGNSIYRQKIEYGGIP